MPGEDVSIQRDMKGRCCARATPQEISDGTTQHKLIEYGYSLEYTRGT